MLGWKSYTDKQITHHSGFLSKVEYGNVILANRGFDIADNLGIHSACLEIPSFMRGKKQMSMKDVECSKKYQGFVYMLNM